MLVLRLMGACNSRCMFCMVQKEMDRSIHRDFEELADQLRALPTGQQVDFFGGEPTLHPRFFELLELAGSLGHGVSVATNGITAARDSVARRIAALPGISVRTSLYGSDASVHEYYTRSPGSFAKTTRGITNLVEAGAPPLVNVVILPRNVTGLRSTFKHLSELGVRTVKVSLVYGGDEIIEHLVQIGLVRTHLLDAIPILQAAGMDLVVEKSPLCLVPSLLNLVLPETDPAMVRSSGGAYTHAPGCRECRLRPACIGVLRPYLQVYGEAGLAGFSEVPAQLVRHIPTEDLTHYEPYSPTELVQVHGTSGRFTTEDSLSLARFVSDLRSKWPGTYLVDDREIIHGSA